MAWSNVGPLVTLAPGASVTWTYVFSGTRDVGIQIADAHTGPHAGPPGLGTAIAFDQGKSVEGLNQAIYRVSIRNTSSTFFVLHNLQGGGVT
jgi:hypothetical protein